MANDVQIGIGTKLDDRGLKQAEYGIRGLGAQIKSATSGIGIFDVTLGNLASSGIQSVVSGAQQVGAAIAQIGVESINLASDAAEAENVLSTVLGSSFDDYENRINKISEATGRSSRAIKQNSQLLIGLVGSQGFATDQTAKLGAELASVALDLESFSNQSGGIEAINQAIKGETEGLARFGVDVREAALQQAALRDGLIDTIGPLDKQTRTLAILSQIYQEQAHAIGDATKTADGYANTQRALTELADDYKVALGSVLIEGVEPLSAGILNMGRTSLPAFEAQMKSAAQGTGEFALGLGTILQNVDKLENSTLGKGLDLFLSTTLADEALEKAFGRVKGYVDDVRQLGLATNIIAEKEAEVLRLKELQEQYPTIDSGYTGPSVDVSSFDAALKASETVGGLDFGALGDINFNDSGIDEFFGTISTESQNAIDYIQEISSTVSGLKTNIDNLNTTDILGNQGDADTKAVDIFAQQSAGAGFSLDDQVNILSATGLDDDAINTRVTDILEQVVADFGVAFTQAGGSVDEALAKIEEYQAIIDSSDNPLALAQNDALGIKSALDDLAAGTYAPVVSITIDGKESLDEAYAKMMAIQGGSVDISAGIISGAGSNAQGRSVADEASRRR